MDGSPQRDIRSSGALASLRRRLRGLIEAPAPAAPGADACSNCGAPFSGPRPSFCPSCGQETAIRPPTLPEFLQHFSGNYIAAEGALWRTLALLLFRPGELTRQYIAGRRKHYVLPLRLYLTISLVTLLLMRMLGSASVDFEIAPSEQAAIARENRNVQLDIGSGKAGLRDGVFYCDGLPAWFCKRLQRRIDIDPKAMGRELGLLKERFLGNLGAAMFLLLPSFALGLKVVYLNRRLRYTEHLVFALHVHAFWFTALTLTLWDIDWLTTVAILAVPVHTIRAMRRVYGGRSVPRLARALTISALYGVVLALAVGGVGLWSLLA